MSIKNEKTPRPKKPSIRWFFVIFEILVKNRIKARNNIQQKTFIAALEMKIKSDDEFDNSYLSGYHNVRSIPIVINDTKKEIRKTLTRSSLPGKRDITLSVLINIKQLMYNNTVMTKKNSEVIIIEKTNKINKMDKLEERNK